MKGRGVVYRSTTCSLSGSFNSDVLNVFLHLLFLFLIFILTVAKEL